MGEDPKTGRLSASFEELAVSNMILVEALVELVVEKGMLSRDEIKQRVERLKAETSVQWKRPQ